jgi:hypothetical protein
MRPMLTSSIVFTSANSTYETQSAQVKQPPANIVLLDRMLAPYGTDTNSVRNLLREVSPLWPIGFGARTAPILRKRKRSWKALRPYRVRNGYLLFVISF